MLLSVHRLNDTGVTDHLHTYSLHRNEKNCNNCNTGRIENEYHFLLICPKFRELRIKYLKRYYYTWPTKQKFINLLNETNRKTVFCLSKFIYYANLLRNSQ